MLTTEVKAKDSKLQEQIKQYEALKADFERQSQELQALGLSNDSLVAKISAVNADLLKLRSFKAGSFSIAQQNLFKQRAQNLEGQLRKKDDDQDEYKARRVEKVKISLNLARNDVSPKETKQIYLRLLEPDGAALYNLSTGGGTFTVDGQEAFYTQKQDVVYDNTRQKMEFIYAKGAEYKKGLHTVELYESGQLMGKTTFTLK